MRFVRISLAAKYRILFGVAVLLIIGAALYVPWYRMEQLVLEQASREAKRVTEDYFRLVLHRPAGVPLPGAADAADLSLSPGAVVPEPKFTRAELRPEDPASVVNQAAGEPFAARALVVFTRNPTLPSTYRTEHRDDGAWFHYARAVRVENRCLKCHTEGGSAGPYRENQLAGVLTVNLPADVSQSGLLVNRVVIVAAGGLAGVLAILVFYVISRRFILAPIDELRDVAVRVTAGDLTVRSQLQTGDEFETLSDSLNTMLERLRLSQEELQRANRLLDQKLGEMAETNVSLYEANRLKSEFLANVSHELRTPLTSIIGFAELLREGPLADPNAKSVRYAENILISGRILLEIINDLLDLAKIEAGKVELRVEVLPLDELCTTLMDFTRPLADKKNLKFEYVTDPELPLLRTDRGRLRQVLFNLLSNAIKFTPENGSVTLTARRIGEKHVQVSVSDTGPGISPEHQALIFEKFRQIDQSATREHHGTGLGLAIAKELTHLLGGEIGFESEVGKGSTFWVRLCTEAPQPRERPLVSLV